MANLTEDAGNLKTIQDLFCTTGLQELHQKIIISCIHIFISVSAFLGNSLTIVAFQKVSSLRPPSKLLFRCLVSTDLCVGLISEPFFVIYLTSPEHSKRCYYVSKIARIVAVMFCGVSLLTLTARSVDRLLALTYGLRYGQVVTLRKTRVFVTICWLSNITTAMLFLYDFRISVVIICIGMLLLLVTSSFCYFKIYRTLRHHQAQVQDHFHLGQPNEGGIPMNIARYRKTVSSAMWVQWTLLACYLPFGIVTALIANSDTPSLALAWDVTVTLLMLNSTLNPFLYCWKMQEVRQAMKNMIRQFCCYPN